MYAMSHDTRDRLREAFRELRNEENIYARMAVSDGDEIERKAQEEGYRGAFWFNDSTGDKYADDVFVIRLSRTNDGTRSILDVVADVLRDYNLHLHFHPRDGTTFTHSQNFIVTGHPYHASVVITRASDEAITEYTKIDPDTVTEKRLRPIVVHVRVYRLTEPHRGSGLPHPDTMTKVDEYYVGGQTESQQRKGGVVYPPAFGMGMVAKLDMFESVEEARDEVSDYHHFFDSVNVRKDTDGTFDRGAFDSLPRQ